LDVTNIKPNIEKIKLVTGNPMYMSGKLIAENDIKSSFAYLMNLGHS
jgi:hypothetical protein